MTATIAFVRRRNREAIVESVCVMCHQTVAIGLSDVDLILPENAHTCDPVQLLHREYVDSQRGTF
jgi:hypothetical protein